MKAVQTKFVDVYILHSNIVFCMDLNKRIIHFSHHSDKFFLKWLYSLLLNFSAVKHFAILVFFNWKGDTLSMLDSLSLILPSCINVLETFDRSNKNSIVLLFAKLTILFSLSNNCR